ncbi:MAG: pyruvate kinase [Methylotenera sp.]|nr:pyruvate kinase [Methylotenera sp.]
MKKHDMLKLKHAFADEETTAYSLLLGELIELRDNLIRTEKEFTNILQLVNAQHQTGATNLIHYLGLRRLDIRPLQEKLAAVGLSSLGRAESHVLPNLQAIITLLQHAIKMQSDSNSARVKWPASGFSLLQNNAKNLLGKLPAERQARIMVTLPADAADDYMLIKDMLIAGMDCARINCAHDDQEVWLRIIEKLRHARRETGRHCRILMDLGGPKLRTGNIALGAAVLKWRPLRNIHGQIVTPARIWLHHEKNHRSCPASADACLPIKGDWLALAKKGDLIKFIDSRGAERKLQLTEKVNKGFWAECNHTAYLSSGTRLHLSKPKSKIARKLGNNQTHDVGRVGTLPQSPALIRLYRGDNLVLTSKPIPGSPAQYDENGHLLRSASISCSMPEVFTMVNPGERILFDDGRIGGVIRSADTDELLIEITQARDSGEKLLSDKGINLPDSELDLHGLTDLDIYNLEFVVHHADMVGLSFSHSASDIELLQRHLKNLNADQLGVVLKVETRAAFEHLPELLLSLLRSPNVGVMVARGDLAVECGYERLAELQEEIMWLAEAAHLPLIWATQVLEGLAKNGKPSRAEISDAAMGARAECVMLNKGPHILEAIQMLDDILKRMQAHQSKKSAKLRRLHW